MTAPIIHFGVLFLGFCFLLHKSYVVVDISLLTSAVTVTFADAAVQVQFIPAPPVPSMQVPVLPQSRFFMQCHMPAWPSNVVLVPLQLLTPVQLSPGIIPVPLPVVPPQLCPKPV